MARGWESKSVEAQQAEAAETTRSGRPRLTPEQAAREHELEGVRLIRKGVLHQLDSARDSRRREMLQAALDELDRRIQALGSN
jgi:hypothetical protein